MGLKQRYLRRKRMLGESEHICEPNRRLFKRFLRWEERKLKRSNGLRRLDEPCFKTLYGYTIHLANVNRWFANKPWSDLTRADIRRVYNGLEDGRILNTRGTPYEDLRGYYNRIFKAKPFELAKKEAIARRVIEYSARSVKEVRFVNEVQFSKLVAVVKPIEHQALFWLAWDIGENIGTLLRLSARDFMPQLNRRTGEREYLVSLPRAKLKRSRLSRGEPTVHSQTVELLDLVLPRRRPNQRVFGYKYRTSLSLIASAARASGATTLPEQMPVRWKDLRSGMACHLLANGWTSDEVNARLGHTPNSSALNSYISFLALSRDDPKHRMQLARQAAGTAGQLGQANDVILCARCGQKFSNSTHGRENRLRL